MRARYPALYAAHFERHWPLLGTHTVDLNALQPALGVAVCCVGSMYDGVLAHRRLATAVMLVQRTALITKLVSDPPLTSIQRVGILTCMRHFPSRRTG